MSETAESPVQQVEKSLDKVAKARAASQQKTEQAQSAEVVNEQPKPTEDKPEAEVKPPVEEPKAEAKPEEKKTKKSKFWKPEEVKNETTDPKGGLPKGDAPKTEVPKDLQDKIANYERLLNKPSVKAVLKAEESGKSFLESYSEMASRDPFKMSYEELYKMQLDEDQYTAEEKERKLKNFLIKDEDDQADIISKFRKDLKSKWNKELEDYSPKFEREEQQPDPNEGFFDQLPSVAKTFEGKELYGIEMTAERLKKITDPNIPIVKLDKNGGINKEDFIRVKAILEYLPLIAETVYEDGVRETTEKWEEMTGGALPSSHGTSLAQSGQVKTDTENRIKNLLSSIPTNKK